MPDLGSTRMNDVIWIFKFVASNVWGVLPVFVIAILLSVLIAELKLDGVVSKAFQSRTNLSIVLATGLGALSPFCSCTVIPVVTTMLLSGVPLAPVMSFWIASPTMDPEIFFLSAGILGWPLAIARLAATLVLSLAAGYLTLTLVHTRVLQSPLLRNKKAPVTCRTTVSDPALGLSASPAGPLILLQTKRSPDVSSAITCCGSRDISSPELEVLPNGESKRTFPTAFYEINWMRVIREAGVQSWSLGRWLLLAFLLEALIVRYVPQEAIASLLGEDNLFAVPLAALVGIPLYLNSVSALPIVSGLLQGGMQPGAALAFLIAGPITTVPAMAAVWGVVRWRVFALYIGIGLVGSIILGLIANIVL